MNYTFTPKLTQHESLNILYGVTWVQCFNRCKKGAISHLFSTNSSTSRHLWLLDFYRPETELFTHHPWLRRQSQRQHRQREERRRDRDRLTQRKTERERDTHRYIQRKRQRQRERGWETEPLAAQLYSKVIRQTRINRFAEIIVDRRGFCPSWSTVLHMSLVPRHHPCWENESHFMVLTTGEKIQVSPS